MRQEVKQSVSDEGYIAVKHCSTGQYEEIGVFFEHVNLP